MNAPKPNGSRPPMRDSVGIPLTVNIDTLKGIIAIKGKSLSLCFGRD